MGWKITKYKVEETKTKSILVYYKNRWITVVQLAEILGENPSTIRGRCYRVTKGINNYDSIFVDCVETYKEKEYRVGQEIYTRRRLARETGLSNSASRARLDRYKAGDITKEQLLRKKQTKKDLQQKTVGIDKKIAEEEKYRTIWKQEQEEIRQQTAAKNEIYKQELIKHKMLSGHVTGGCVG